MFMTLKNKVLHKLGVYFPQMQTDTKFTNWLLEAGTNRFMTFIKLPILGTKTILYLSIPAI